MKQSYQHQELEAKWQKRWAETHLYRTKENAKLPKYYILDMFPYPSGAGLHVGHPKGYIATDIVARCKTMQGYRVLHPMGWDAFGLPAENYAIKNKVHPAVATAKNVTVFKKQLQSLGFSYDWEREINTTGSEFYRWTQWIFLQLYHHYYDKRLNRAQPISKLIEKKFGTNDYYALDKKQQSEIDRERLAFEEYAPINWCPSCQTGLANEDLEDGKCERCGSVIEKKPMKQWNLRITKYAERMLADLSLLEWEEFIKTMQINWIGKSIGAKVNFVLKTATAILPTVSVFTTRLDTLFGCSYVVISPEHPLLEQLLCYVSEKVAAKVKQYCLALQEGGVSEPAQQPDEGGTPLRRPQGRLQGVFLCFRGAGGCGEGRETDAALGGHVRQTQRTVSCGLSGARSREHFCPYLRSAPSYGLVLSWMLKLMG